MSVDPQTVRRRRFETAIDPIRGRPDPQRPRSARRVASFAARGDGSRPHACRAHHSPWWNPRVAPRAVRRPADKA